MWGTVFSCFEYIIKNIKMTQSPLIDRLLYQNQLQFVRFFMTIINHTRLSAF